MATNFGGARYWRGKLYKTWDDMSAAVKSAGINPDDFLKKHQAVQKAYGVSPQNVTLPGSPDAPSEGAGGPVGSSVIPGVGIYGMMQSQAELAYEQALGSIQQREQDILQQYGFQGQSGAEGVTNITEDPTSAYGVLPMLRRSQAITGQRQEDITAGRGIGRRGLAEQGQEDLQYQAGYEQAQAFSGFRRDIQEAAQARQEASSSLGQTNLQIEMAALQDAIASGQFTPADVSSLLEETTTTGGGKKKKPGQAGGGKGKGRPPRGKGKPPKGVVTVPGPTKNQILYQQRLFNTTAQLRKYLQKRGKNLRWFKKRYPSKWKTIVGKDNGV